MLYLGNLPIRVGAFHPMGTNDIVLNRRLVNSPTDLKQKAHIFTILLHEYLNTLGYRDEKQVRQLVYSICRENFGRNHPVLRSAISGPWADLNKEDFEEIKSDLDLELVRDFERIDMDYII
jgi:hypothetical protein